MGTWGRGSQWCNRLLWIIVILRSRFLFGESESEQRREVRTDEKARYVVDRGAHDGDDDVVLRGGVRGDHDNSGEWWRQHAERERERCSDRIVEPCGPPAARAERLSTVELKKGTKQLVPFFLCR